MTDPAELELPFAVRYYEPIASAAIGQRRQVCAGNADDHERDGPTRDRVVDRSLDYCWDRSRQLLLSVERHGGTGENEKR